MTEKVITAATPAETQAAGAELAARLHGGEVLLLRGDLGAGKTTFAQGIARGLKVHGPVQSPTFTLIAEYPVSTLGRGGQFVHVDLYRLEGEFDVSTIGLEEYFDCSTCVTVIEWPDRAGTMTYPPHWSVELELTADETRRITIQEPASE